MGFLDSLLSWLFLTLIIGFILFVVFAYFLRWFYPQYNVTSSSEDSLEDPELTHRQRKWIGLFVLFALVVIMTSTGIRAFLNTKS